MLPTAYQEETTRELTGHDASMDEAAVGDAGSGASPYGADFTGGLPEDIEAAPDMPSDIVPDSVEDWPEALEAREEEREEPELTARPSERMPIDPSEFR